VIKLIVDLKRKSSLRIIMSEPNNNNNNNNNDAAAAAAAADNININNRYMNFNLEMNAHPHPNRNLEDVAMAAVLLPLARANLLDYLYASGLPLMPVQLGGAGVGGVGGVGGGGGADLDIDGIASILANSLYDSRPVKNVVDEKGIAQITEKIYTAQMAEELKINTVCGIWQDDFEEGEPIKILPCNHAFKADAITRWLSEDKAECPICRFSLSSKEVICHRHAHGEHGDGMPELIDSSDGEGEGDEVEVQEQDALQVNENNIAARLVDSIHNRVHREDPVRAVYAGVYASRQSISVPINQLLQSRRNMIDNIARASGSVRIASRWPIARSGGGGGGAVAGARHHDERHHYINNNYYFGNVINQPVIDNRVEAQAEARDDRENENEVDSDDNNNYNNYNYNDYNNNYYNNIPNREQADIEEAIRRSLEEQ
jgi:Ring finger domain